MNAAGAPKDWPPKSVYSKDTGIRLGYLVGEPFQTDDGWFVWISDHKKVPWRVENVVIL